MATDLEASIVPHETRLQDSSGYTGTIVYVGSVASALNPNQVYVGVIWDDHSRGKHDGSVISKDGKLVRHFQAPGPTAASFIKLEKIDTGVVLNLQVLKEKYRQKNADLIAPNNLLPHKVSNKEVEFLGELKIRDYQQLEDIPTISLRRCGINAIDTAQDWSSLQHITHLDLAGNLFHQWQQLIYILQTFSCLKELSLAANRMHGTFDTSQTFPNLEELNLLQTNCNGMIWKELHTFCPNLKSLCLSHADLSDLVDEAFAESLQTLDLSSATPIDLDKIARVAPNIQSLSLNDTSIDDIDTILPVREFSLCGTQIAKWDTVSKLHTLCPNLTSLRLSHCPLTKELGQMNVRHGIIARLPNLTSLNGTLVSTDERYQAERRYLSQSNESDPLYQELIAKHPQFVKSIMTASDGRMVVVTITVHSLVPHACNVTWTRKVPVGMTLEKLKSLLEKPFEVDGKCQQITLKQPSGPPVVLDENDRRLEYFGLTDGAELYLQEVEPERESGFQDRTNDEWERKIEEQEAEINRFEERKKALG